MMLCLRRSFVSYNSIQHFFTIFTTAQILLMPLYTDQIGNVIELKKTPAKIISVVPSQTELLHRLGLNEEVIGITKFCIHPKEWFKTKQRVGGTKQLDLKKIRSLQPQLIIANKEENVKEQIEELSKEFPVWTSDINNMDEALEMIRSLGEIVGKEETAWEIINNITSGFAALKENRTYKVCYLIWKNPYMTVGGDTFINSMMQYCSFINIYADQRRYPSIEIDDLITKEVDLILLSSEPYPFKEKHIDEIKTVLPQAKILLVDGEMFSWYGSRLEKASQYFKKLQQQIDSL